MNRKRILKVSAECHSDDYAVECKFDATPFFKKATGKQLVALAAAAGAGTTPRTT